MNARVREFFGLRASDVERRDGRMKVDLMTSLYVFMLAPSSALK